MRLKPVGLVVMLALALMVPLTVDAQPSGMVHRIGWLSAGPPPSAPDWRQTHPFLQGLRELGYSEGRNLVIEVRWAEGRFERLPDLAAELLRLQVEVIFAEGGVAVRAAQQATDTLPIVTVTADPLRQGLVASLARPGGNITGVSTRAVDLSQKLLEILKEALSGVSRMAVLWCPDAGSNRQQLQEMHVAAHALGVQLLPLEVRSTEDDVEALFETATKARVEGLVVFGCNIIAVHQGKIVELAAKYRLPAMYAWRSYVANGGLMSYGPNFAAHARRAAAYVDKILKGAKPADLPVEQPMTFELVINLKTAQTLGLTIPPLLLYQAAEVIR
jgi:putative tryptophan/tyrosine transport system substrate-binding protein